MKMASNMLMMKSHVRISIIITTYPCATQFDNFNSLKTEFDPANSCIFHKLKDIAQLIGFTTSELFLLLDYLNVSKMLYLSTSLGLASSYYCIKYSNFSPQVLDVTLYSEVRLACFSYSVQIQPTTDSGKDVEFGRRF